jgi:glucose/arabinose dehydrogenase
VSIFGKIKDAIFGHHSAQAQQPQQAPQAQAQAKPAAMPQMQQPAQQPAPAQPQQQVDVEAVLKQIAQEKGNPHLNYDSSIVDLMKLLDLDSSLSNREELATELGYTGAKDGSAEMNIWLHKAVMQELAKNGGKVPANLTH